MITKNYKIALCKWKLQKIISYFHIGFYWFILLVKEFKPDLWLNTTGILPSWCSVTTIAWLHHIDSNKMRGKKKVGGELNKDTTRSFEQILEVVHCKAVVRPFISYLASHHARKESKTFWALLVKWGRIHKRRSFMDSYLWTHQCWPICKHFNLSALRRHYVLSRGLTKSDGRWGQMTRESQMKLCCWYVLMMTRIAQTKITL